MMTVEEHRKLVGMWRTLMAVAFGACLGIDLARSDDEVGWLGLPVAGALICWIVFEIVAMVTEPDQAEEIAEVAYRSITIDYVVAAGRENVADLIFDEVVDLGKRHGFKVDGASGGPTEGAPGTKLGEMYAQTKVPPRMGIGQR